MSANDGHGIEKSLSHAGLFRLFHLFYKVYHQYCYKFSYLIFFRVRISECPKIRGCGFLHKSHLSKSAHLYRIYFNP